MIAPFSELPPFVRIGLAVFALVAVIAFFPLRVVLDLAGLGNGPISARQVRGPLWAGRIDDLMLGGLFLGDVEAGVAPWPLLVGRVRLDIAREAGQGDDIVGAWTIGFNQRGIDDVTGLVPVAGLFAPVPIDALELDDVTVHFAGDTCAKAQGRVRARLSGSYAGLNLSRGLGGAAICDGRAVLLPLVSQSGMERLSLRFWRDGRYSVQIAVKDSSGIDAGALAAAGLVRSGESHILTLDGRW